MTSFGGLDVTSYYEKWQSQRPTDHDYGLARTKHMGLERLVCEERGVVPTMKEAQRGVLFLGSKNIWSYRNGASLRALAFAVFSRFYTRYPYGNISR